MKNKNGFISMTLVYTFLILFLFLMSGILTSYNQRNKYYDIIEEKIKSEMDLTSFRNDTLYNTILKIFLQALILHAFYLIKIELLLFILKYLRRA